MLKRKRYEVISLRKFQVCATTLLSCCLMINLVACTAGKTQPEADMPSFEDKISIDGYNNVAAQLDYESGTVRLPLDPYIVQSTEMGTKWSHAFDVLVETCVVDQGLPYTANQVDWNNLTPDDDRLFGRWSVKLAEQYGFNSAPGAGGSSMLPEQTNPASQKASETCYDQARKLLEPIGEFSDSQQIDVRISSLAYMQVEQSVDGKAAIDRRTQCLESQGYVVGGDAYLDEKYNTQGEAQQLSAATTFAKCQLSSGAIDELYNLLARYQAAYIDKYEAQLVALQKETQKHKSELDRFIESGA